MAFKASVPGATPAPRRCPEGLWEKQKQKQKQQQQQQQKPVTSEAHSTFTESAICVLANPQGDFYANSYYHWSESISINKQGEVYWVINVIFNQEIKGCDIN